MGLPITTSAQQRDAIVAIAPPWLQHDEPPVNGGPLGVGGRFLYNIGLADDALLEKLNQGMLARMPAYATPTALPLIGNDRLLTQGPEETTASFRLRLQEAFQTWRLAGERIAVMRLVGAYMQGFLQLKDSNPVMAIIGGHGSRVWSTYYTQDAAAGFPDPPALVRETTANFSWDGFIGAYRWWRNWLVFYNQALTMDIGGAVATIGSPSGVFFPLTGLLDASLGTQTNFNSFVTITGAATPANNGTFQVTTVNSDTEITYVNPFGTYPDANAGAINWSLSYFPQFAPAPVWGTPGMVWGGNTNLTWGMQYVGAANSFDMSGFLKPLRSIISLWKSAHTFYEQIIFTWFGGDGTSGFEFSPNSTESTGNPNGTWGSGAKIDTTDAYGNLLNPTGAPSYVGSYNTGQNSQLSAMVAVTDGTAIYQQCSTPTGC